MGNSFLHDYLHYASGNECPEMFHVWGGYAALSAAVGRKVWLPFEDIAIFPNIYVMYVGDAGNGKSWALGKMKRLLAECALPYSGSLETPPGMWRWMAGNPQADPPVESPVKFVARWPDGVLRDVHPMTIVANEFINFISLDQQGWVNSLNDIYDEDKYHYRTKNAGEDTLIGPYIVLVGALTTEVSSDLQKARIISTGLARRTIFQYGQRAFGDPHAIPEFTESQRAARTRCVEYMRMLAAKSLNGAFSWDDEVRDWWVKWYNPYLATVPKQNPTVRSWFASKPTQVLKIAMLTSLADKPDLILTVDHFEVALAYLTKLEEDLPKIFGGVGRNELAGVAVKIFEFVAGGGDLPVAMGLVKTNFFNSCRPPHDFDQCIAFLCESGQLKRTTLIIGNQVDDIIAVPKVLDAFVEVARKRQAEALRGLPQDVDHVIDPSIEP